MKTKVSIVEDHSPYRAHLAALIGGSDEFECAGAHSTAELAAKHIPVEKPHLVLLDLELPKMSGLQFIQALKDRMTEVEIVVLTMHKDPRRIFAALETGACGYLVKPVPPAKILDALAEARAGGSPMSGPIARMVVQTFRKSARGKRELELLSAREREILDLLAQGYRNKEIANRSNISERTVATHLRNIYDKLRVCTRAAATAKYLKAGP